MTLFRFSSFCRLMVAVTAASLPASLGAQFVNETPVTVNGVRLLVRPAVSIATSPEGVVRVTLTEIFARLDRTAGVSVDGQQYPYTAFNGALRSFFDAVEVRTLSLGITFDGVAGCSGRVGFATWRVGGSETLSCNSGSQARVTGYSVNGATTSGALELQSEVRRLLRAERDRQAQEARDQRQTTAAGTVAGAVTPPATPAATPPATPASTSQPQSTSTDEAQRQQAAARAEAEAAAARQQLAEMTRANEAARAQLIDNAAQQTATALMALGQMLDERGDRKRREAAAEAARVRQQMLALRAAARVRAAENLLRDPVGRRCDGSELRTMTFGQAASGSYDLDTCRGEDNRGLIQYRVALPHSMDVEFDARGSSYASFELLDSRGTVVMRIADAGSVWRSVRVRSNETYTVRIRPEFAGGEGNYAVTLRRRQHTLVGSTPASWFAYANGGGWSGERDFAFQPSDGVVGGVGLGMTVKLTKNLAGQADAFFGAGGAHFGFGARYWFLSDFARFRPFVAGEALRVNFSSGPVATTSGDPGFESTSTVGWLPGLSVGASFFPQDFFSIDLAFSHYTGTVTDERGETFPYSMNRIRIGLSIFAQ